MKKSLPCFALLAAVTVVAVAKAATPYDVRADAAKAGAIPQAAEAAPSAQAARGDELLVQAVNQLEQRASVTARFLYHVAIGGEDLDGSLSYWQQGRGEDLKVRLEVRLVGLDAQLLHVCNSRFIWNDRKLPTGRTVTRIDLRQLRADPSLAGGNLNEIKPGQANWSPLQSELITYTGGLPSLLNGLSESFRFMAPQAIQFQLNRPADAEPVKVPVFGVVGQWKPEKLAAQVAKTQDNSGAVTQHAPDLRKLATKNLPERLPLEVLILLRQEDLFPYRIEYRRLETPNSIDNAGPPIPYQLSVHPMVVLQLDSATFDAPIASGQFDYAPGDADFDDQTTVILERLRQQRQAQIATRAAEPAGARQ